MNEKEYLQKIAELRQEGDETLYPLLDYLEQYRPGDARGLIDSESIRCTLDGVVDLELNTITTVMVKLGYKVVYNELAEDYGWNMARARKEEELIISIGEFCYNAVCCKIRLFLYAYFNKGDKVRE